MLTTTSFSEERITTAHRGKLSYIYVRQSSPGKVRHHQESTELQYRLVERAVLLCWPRERIHLTHHVRNLHGIMRCSVVLSWPRHCSTDCCTMPSSCRSRVPAIGSASTPTCWHSCQSLPPPQHRPPDPIAILCVTENTPCHAAAAGR